VPDRHWGDQQSLPYPVLWDVCIAYDCLSSQRDTTHRSRLILSHPVSSPYSNPLDRATSIRGWDNWPQNVKFRGGLGSSELVHINQSKITQGADVAQGAIRIPPRAFHRGPGDGWGSGLFSWHSPSVQHSGNANIKWVTLYLSQFFYLDTLTEHNSIFSTVTFSTQFCWEEKLT